MITSAGNQYVPQSRWRSKSTFIFLPHLQLMKVSLAGLPANLDIQQMLGATVVHDNKREPEVLVIKYVYCYDYNFYIRKIKIDIPAAWCCMLSTTEHHDGIGQKEPVKSHQKNTPVNKVKPFLNKIHE